MATKRELFSQWLERDQLPDRLNHYGLLGIKPQHATPTLVTQRAKQLLARIRRHDPGTFRPFWLELQHRIVAAHKCLLDPDAKAAYDAQLLPLPTAVDTDLPPTVPPPASQKPSIPIRPSATNRSNRSPSPIIATATPAPPPDVSTRIPIVRTSNVTLELRRRHRNSSVGCLVATLSSIALLGVTGLLVLLYLDRHPQLNDARQWTFRNPMRQGTRTTRNDSGHSRPAANAAPDSAAAEHSGAPAPILPDERRPVTNPGEPATDPREDTATSPLAPIVVPVATVASDEDDEPLVEPESLPFESTNDKGRSDAVFSKRDAQVLGESLRRARSNLGLRKWSAVQPHLERARQHARLPHHRENVARLQRLHYYVTEFWKAVREGLGMLDGGMEIPAKDSVVIVVEASEERLILRANGRNRTFLLNEIPGKLALVLADQWFQQEAASTPLIKGAFMAVDPDFDKTSALEMIRSAPNRNQDVLDVLQAVEDTFDFGDDVTPNL